MPEDSVHQITKYMHVLLNEEEHRALRVLTADSTEVTASKS
jgi:hypothetical protein